MGIFDKLSNTWALMGVSWDILKKDKEMLIYPLISGICCLLVLASFAIPIISSESWQPPGENAPAMDQVVYYGVLFLFYFCNYFVIVFFNTAIIACAVKRMQGGDPTLSDGFQAAFSRIHLIAGWALVSATVGLILKIIEDRSEKVGQIVSGLLGMAWTVVSFLVVPVLVVEQKGPFGALKESTQLLRKTWGEQLISGFSFSFLFFILSIPAFLLIFLAFASSLTYLFIGLAVVYLIVLALVQSALQAIFQAVVYLYAKDGQVPEGFNAEMLRTAMVPK